MFQILEILLAVFGIASELSQPEKHNRWTYGLLVVVAIIFVVFGCWAALLVMSDL